MKATKITISIIIGYLIPYLCFAFINDDLNWLASEDWSSKRWRGTFLQMFVLSAIFPCLIYIFILDNEDSE